MRTVVLGTLLVGGAAILAGCATRTPLAAPAGPMAARDVSAPTVESLAERAPLPASLALHCSAPLDEPPAPPAAPASAPPAAAPPSPPAPPAPPAPESVPVPGPDSSPVPPSAPLAPDLPPAPPPPATMAPIPVRPAPIAKPAPAPSAYTPGTIVVYPPGSGACGSCPAPALRQPCCEPEGTLGGGLAIGPDVGASINGTYVIRRPSYGEWSAELRVTGLLVDNTEFHHQFETGDPGEWWQLEGGLKFVAHPEERTHWFGRIGAVVADVNGHADIVDGEGTHYGGYVGIGFETRLTPRITMGPDISFLVLGGGDRDSSVVLVPQFGWTLSYMLGGCPTQATCHESDLYVGLVGSVLPGIGGGMTFGQVFARNRRAVWSFELSAQKQSIDDIFGAPNDSLNDSADAAYSQVRAGAKASFSPDCRRHLTARFGFAAFKATGTNDFIDKATTYYGGYVGVGYEWDLNRHWSTGPEATVLFGSEGHGAEQFVPQFSWHVTYWL